MDLLKMVRFKKPSTNKDTPSTSHSHSHSHSPHDPPQASTSTSIYDHQNHADDPDADDQDAADDDNEEDEDEADFITNEVKRRLKELRKNSFMVLIPEEEPTPDDDHPHSPPPDAPADCLGSPDLALPSSLGLDALDAWLCGFDALYNKYCQSMLFFDRSIAHLLSLPYSPPSRKSPRSSSANKLASTLRNLSFKRRDHPDSDLHPLQPHPAADPQPDPYHTLETAYVAQLSLSWEALHTQYAHLSIKIASSQPDTCTSYTHAAQAFQQFQVLLQRFIETEPFEPGSRVDIYTRSRAHLSKLLQVPNFQGLDRGSQPRNDESDSVVAATDLIRVLEESILTFRLFLKKDKTKPGAVLGAHSTAGSSLHQVQASLDKKEMRVKELFKKKKGWKSKLWPGSPEEVELLFALIDIKVVARVLRMAQLSKEQLLWCEEKMSKIDLSSDSKLRRDASPILFPC